MTLKRLESVLAATVLVVGVGLTVVSLALGPAPAEKITRSDWTRHAIPERTFHGENDPSVDAAGRLLRRRRLQFIDADPAKALLTMPLTPQAR